MLSLPPRRLVSTPLECETQAAGVVAPLAAEVSLASETQAAGVEVAPPAAEASSLDGPGSVAAPTTTMAMDVLEVAPSAAEVSLAAAAAACCC